MTEKIEKIRNLRLFLLRQLEGLATEQLTKIPAGFNNNIVWNLGHLICAEQSLCYGRAGQPLVVPDEYFSPYLPTTKPTRALNDAEITTLKELFISTIDQLAVDAAAGLFSRYTSSTMLQQVYGVSVDNLGDALSFLLYHEGLHAGYILALKHVV